MDNKTVHKLKVTKKDILTECGQQLMAVYPPSLTAMLEQAGAEPIRITLDKGVTCEACIKKMKEW